MIPYGRQSISEQDVEAVVAVLRSDFLTQGPVLPKFEEQVCQYTGAAYGVAVHNGTAALHIACLALGLGAGDWLWTSPITFVASANCALYCGARVDFVDIDPVTWNLSVDRLREKLQQARRQGRLPKVVVAVHLCGLPCAMREMRSLAQEYGFFLIEDGCHALGGTYLESPVGSCRYSDITVFSFHPVKTITSGEGGMAVTNSRELARKMRLFRNHGITRDPDLMTAEVDGPWCYQQIVLGMNYRMTELQAALGMSQMRRLDSFVDRRHQLADRYDQALADAPLILPHRRSDSGTRSGMHLYVVRLQPGHLHRSRREIFEYMQTNGIGVQIHYIPVHRQPFYRAMGFCAGDFPEAESYYREALTLPLFPGLSSAEQDRVIETLLGAVS